MAAECWPFILCPWASADSADTLFQGKPTSAILLDMFKDGVHTPHTLRVAKTSSHIWTMSHQCALPTVYRIKLLPVATKS